MPVTYEDLFRHLRQNNGKIVKNEVVKNALFDFVVSQQPALQEFEHELRTQVGVFVGQLYAKWAACNRIEDRFLQKWKQWFKIEFQLPQAGTRAGNNLKLQKEA